MGATGDGNARSGPVGEGPWYCVQCLQGRLQEALHGTQRWSDEERERGLRAEQVEGDGEAAWGLPGSGVKRVTNRATLWYVPLSADNVNSVVNVPPLQYSSPEQEEEGRKRYEAQKLNRSESKQRNGTIIFPTINVDRKSKEPCTVGYSQSSLIHLVGPSDCTLHNFLQGGVTMKLMDEVAGIVAARHCKTNIVTASVDAINFHQKIEKGSVINVSGRMIFTSNKSMEIEVVVDVDHVLKSPQESAHSVTAFFTYVSLGKDGTALPIPTLKFETEDEKKRFEEGRVRYLQAKARRTAEATKKCQ
ncbi:cytosolic acyl coenzyme A thioester hydrolase [Amblyraja radiata]|uniref:cytosolic acyl coenzyme A thioester hydrolase n=1 Tax=Amblyraja radiata TaxID=386614 RepID=UPI001403D366|nr:cytosolic acyl coenzyme A thioester hydrolase [Amblyraja radiata]